MSEQTTAKVSKRLHQYVTEQDKQMVFVHEGEKVRYYITAHWDDNHNTYYVMSMFEAGSVNRLDDCRFYSEADVTWAMKDVSKDLRKWKVC